MIAYASRTGTRRNLDALRQAGWRLLVSATGPHRTEGFPYAIDNGAWTAHQQGAPFDELAFCAVVEALGGDADFVVVPDIVAGGLASLEMSRRWLPWVLARTRRALIAVQDGMTLDDVAPLLSERVGVAIGGSTEWKLAALGSRSWSASWLHVLRVNTARRIRLCGYAGAHSFDGSSASRFAVNVPSLEAARGAAAAQGSLL